MNASRSLTLSDGRVCGYAEWAALDGWPVVHLHGSPGSRLERYPDLIAIEAMGVRLITLDRPGYGLSSQCPSWTLQQCATDIAFLADELGLDRFALQGFSAGAPYVLAAAAILGERISSAAILAGLGPLDHPGALDGMLESNACEFMIARDEPSQLLEYLIQRRHVPALPASEFTAISNLSGLLDVMLESYEEIWRQGYAGVMGDDLAVVAEWGFSLEAIRTPLHIWHGDRDPVVPFHHAQFVAEQVRSATLHACVGEGHFDMFRHQHEIVSVLKG